MFAWGQEVLITDQQHMRCGFRGVVAYIRNTDVGTVYGVELNYGNGTFEVVEGGLQAWEDAPADEFVNFVQSLPERTNDAKVDLSPEGIAKAWYGDDWGPRIKQSTVDAFLDWMIVAMKRRGSL